MIITIVSKLDDSAQLWTFDIEESDLVQIMEKYAVCGESVLVDTDELHDEIKNYYK